MGNADLGPLFGPGYFDPQSGEREEPADAPAPQAAVSPQQPGAGAAPKDPLARPRSLEDVLRAQGWISNEQWEQAVRIQGRDRLPIGQILIEMGAITEEQLARALALQWRLPFLSLSEDALDPACAQLVPAHLARRHALVPLGRRKNRLVVAIADPANALALDDVRLVTGLEVDLAVATPSDIARAQAALYADRAVLDALLSNGRSPASSREEAEDAEISADRLLTMAEDAPVVRAVNQILARAAVDGASDVHIEPHRRDLRVRFRVDGVLHDAFTLPRAAHAALVSRVKVIANMDIAERRLPQDGHVHVTVEGRELDLRISTLPTVLGEKVVIRILDPARTRTTLPQLGFAGDLLAAWERLIASPYGLILVTGPTGSGKTTTLYTSLARINTPERNIVSIEDPVEYQIPRVNQVQVNPRIGLTFAHGLRTILRQDPDVVLVGEIRDRETAEIAVQASLTGHLVLSTVHTNDAPGAVTRLVDMGVEPFLIASSLVGVLAQRLVRVVCARCREQYDPPPDALRRLGLSPGEAAGARLVRGRGCDACRRTGYRGRTGVFELMVMSQELRQLVVRGATADSLRDAARRAGMRTLLQHAVLKVLQGVTTVEEVLRVIMAGEETP